ncbi:MAG: hypothetical protein NTU94_17540 [Planctomycetota bacterium]|nr:hypothetical protein [Planctomycetota bacterium]
MTLTAEAQDRVVVLCRSQDRRALLERLVGASETFPSAVDACLAVARRPARAVVVNLEDVEGVEREVVAAMRHAQPDLPIYALVKPEDEPLGRRLLREGAADYFVLPTDVARLPGILSAEGGTRSAE